jgi:hypothetical protein
MPDLYAETAAELGDPDTTGPIPVAPEEVLATYQALPPVPAHGADDDLLIAAPAAAGALRPDDLALEQPPQDPDWRPDAHS